MVNGNLKDYIKKELEQGYSLSSIRNRLLESGYSAQQVETAIKLARPKKMNFLLLGIVLVLVVVLSGIFLMIFLWPSGEEIEIEEGELRLETILTQDEIQAGENLNLQIKIRNLGRREEYEIRSEIIIFDEEGIEVESKEEDLVMSEEEVLLTKSSQISVPGDLTAGSYVLTNMIFYDGKSAKRNMTFRILQREAARVPGATAEPATGVGEISQEEQIRIDSIKEVALSDWEQARELCVNRLENTLARDRCLRDIGIELNKPEFCELISDAGEKDTCFLSVALGLPDYTLCSQISEPRLRDTCQKFR